MSPGAQTVARHRDYYLPLLLEGGVVATHAGAQLALLRTRVALAVERAPEDAVEEADGTEDVDVQVVRPALGGLIDAEDVTLPACLSALLPVAEEGARTAPAPTMGVRGACAEESNTAQYD